MMSSGGGGGGGFGGGADGGAAVGAAVGAEVGAAVGLGAGVDAGPGPGALLAGRFARRRGAGSEGALPSTTIFGCDDGVGTAGSTGSPVFLTGFAPPSSPPIPATA